MYLKYGIFHHDKQGNLPAKSPLDIYRLLPGTNCGACGQPTCLAFATAVINKNAQPSLCPHLDQGVIQLLEGQVTTRMTVEEKQLERLAGLKQKVPGVDLAARAEALGGRFAGGKLTIQCLGKDFSVDQQGRLSSQCHTHPWFAIPFLSYILFGQGKAVSGRWVTFRNLRNGTDWDAFFDRQCTLKLKQLADMHGELFGDLISMFGATMAEKYLESDVSVILRPFPKVPMMVCYWRPEEELASELRVFFDSTADQNLGTEAAFGLGTAFVRMLEKIVEKHV